MNILSNEDFCEALLAPGTVKTVYFYLICPFFYIAF